MCCFALRCIRCMWVGYLYNECQRAEHPPGWLGGLLPVEYDDFRTLLRAGSGAVRKVELPFLSSAESPGAAGSSGSSSSPRHVVVAADKVAALLEGTPRVALLDVVVSGPEGETGPEARAVAAIIKALASPHALKQCFEPSSARRRGR